MVKWQKYSGVICISLLKILVNSVNTFSGKISEFPVEWIVFYKKIEKETYYVFFSFRPCLVVHSEFEVFFNFLNAFQSYFTKGIICWFISVKVYSKSNGMKLSNFLILLWEPISTSFDKSINHTSSPVRKGIDYKATMDTALKSYKICGSNQCEFNGRLDSFALNPSYI